MGEGVRLDVDEEERHVWVRDAFYEDGTPMRDSEIETFFRVLATSGNTTAQAAFRVMGSHMWINIAAHVNPGERLFADG